MNYRYTVRSFHCASRNPRKMVLSNRIVEREPQVLFGPDLKLFGMSASSRNEIKRCAIGDVVYDSHGDRWERIA